MGAFFTPSEEPGVKRTKRSGATLIPGSSDGTLCAAIAEQMSGVARSLRRKTLSLSLPCGWVHFKLPKWVKSKLALTTSTDRDAHSPYSCLYSVVVGAQVCVRSFVTHPSQPPQIQADSLESFLLKKHTSDEVL